jgi:ribonucleoside-diphosphate reductase alpha subunit
MINSYLELIKKESNIDIDIDLIFNKVNSKLYDGIDEELIINEIAETCVNLISINPDYTFVASRILIKNLHDKTLNTFSDKIILLGEHNIINKSFVNYVIDNKDIFDYIIDYNKDFNKDYFGFKTLEKAYLLKINNNIIERPQDMILRTAITLNKNNIELIIQTYNAMADGYYTHATPTLFNSGTNYEQLSSCFLLGTNDDLNDISITWQSCAKISKWAGGIGLHITNIRGKNSIIKGTNGKSNGIVPFLKVFNEIARWIDQGGKRPGSIAIYIEPYHPDIFDFLELRKNFGSETERARDLFLALWIPDLFMKQVNNDDDWYLLSADECPDLNEVYGDEFELLYWKYVKENKYRNKIKARTLWMNILDSQIETGMPYMCYKDNVNKKNNQQNLGTIKSSNLCAEIVQYSDHNEYAICNLASIALKQFVKPFHKFGDWKIYVKPDCKFCIYAKNYLDSLKINYKVEDDIVYLKKILNKDKITLPQIFVDKTHIGGWDELYNYTKSVFDFNKLYDIAYLATINLNNVIDVNYYPVPQTLTSNYKHRPIGLGIQGLADVLVLLRIPFESESALELNSYIMETIYYASLTASNDIAKDRYYKICNLDKNISYPEYYDKNFNKDNELYHELKPLNIEILKCTGAYSTFEGSLFSKGFLQFDMWNNVKLNYQWDNLKESIKKYGTRNSLLTALMPTASTSQILGNNECFEFFTNNIYTRKTQAGDFMVINKYLVQDLINIGIWNNSLKDKIIANNGSVLNINEIPQVIKNLYKTIWEIKQIWVLKHAIARGPFVDQSQSMNIFMGEPDYQRLTSCHFYGWSHGLKTGMYYLRSKPSTDAIKITIDPTLLKSIESCINCSA